MTNDNLRELGKALLSHLDAIMPAIERGIAAEWKRGNFINGPQFGETLEAFRRALASVDRNPEGEKPQALSAKHESAVGAAETP